MSKKYLFTLIILILAALGVGVWMWYTNQKAAPSPSNSGTTSGTSTSVPVPAPTPISTPTPSTNTFPVATQSGGAMNVQDFTSNSKSLPGETKNYVLEETDPRFSIEYAGFDRSFSINLNQAPFPETQRVAEAAFLAKLNISKERACSLKVTVGIPGWASDNAVGINYGLSWCPFAIPVPEN